MHITWLDQSQNTYLFIEVNLFNDNYIKKYIQNGSSFGFGHKIKRKTM
jgi:hypothetical protein